MCVCVPMHVCVCVYIHDQSNTKSSLMINNSSSCRISNAKKVSTLQDAKILQERNKIVCELRIEVIFVGPLLYFSVACSFAYFDEKNW